jgi:hypothetical protein
MCGLLIPRGLDRVFESQHLDPKVLKTEGFWSPRYINLGEEKRAMVGQGRRKGIEDVGGKGDIPIFIAKEPVKLAHGGVLLLIAPRILAVLQMNLFEITSV